MRKKKYLRTCQDCQRPLPSQLGITAGLLTNSAHLLLSTAGRNQQDSLLGICKVTALWWPKREGKGGRPLQHFQFNTIKFSGGKILSQSEHSTKYCTLRFHNHSLFSHQKLKLRFSLCAYTLQYSLIIWSNSNFFFSRLSLQQSQLWGWTWVAHLQSCLLHRELICFR